MLYGVIAIMSAELAVEPGLVSHAQAAIGALLIGLAMMVTRVFVEVTKKETELGSHLKLAKAGALVRQSLFVMVFPAIVAAVILIERSVGASDSVVIDTLLYLSVAAVFVLGFGSSYVLDRGLAPAATRGLAWAALSLVLLAAKKLG